MKTLLIAISTRNYRRIPSWLILVSAIVLLIFAVLNGYKIHSLLSDQDADSFRIVDEVGESQPGGHKASLASARLDTLVAEAPAPIKKLYRVPAPAFARTVATQTGGANENLPQMGPGMVNVTAQKGWLTLKGLSGARQAVAVQVDDYKVPMGYGISDVFVFRFNKQTESWVQLERDSLDASQQVVYATATEDGDFVAAIIKSPEAPESQGYMPTTIKDIKAGDPASKVQIIAPPTANRQGSATLSYHIEVPPGRQGVQPDISVGYDSDAGLGALGEGWQIRGLSSISVDTRWGTPAYDGDTESETYLLDGQMLACMNGDTAITPHRFLNTPRAMVTKNKVTRFYLRKEGAFNRIERHGDTTTEYYWIITDKKGTKFFYGGPTANNLTATLRHPQTGQIAEWKLCKVEDVFGNIMEITYKQTAQVWDGMNGERVANITPATIQYTRFISAVDPDFNRKEANFELVFNFLPKTNSGQVQINGRYGFLNGNTDSLVDIFVHVLKTKELIRRYRFFYKTDPLFGRVLLDSIGQYGLKDAFFNGHKFKYHQASAQGLFGPAKTWAVPDDGLGPFSFNLVSNATTAIGGTKSTGKQFGSYFGVGVMGSPVHKSNTVGVQFKGGSNSSEGVNALVDINGDGKPDKVISYNGGIYYYANNGVGFEIRRIPVTGVGASSFAEDDSRVSSSGFQANFGGVFVGTDKQKSETTISTYFQDVNADGFMDIVSNNVVYFNGGLGANGNHNFSPYSTETPVPLSGSGAVARFETSQVLQTRNEELANDNPLQEVVRVWEAPMDGQVTITAPVKMLGVPLRDRDKDYEKADGVVVSVQLGGAQILDSVTIPLSGAETEYLTTPKTAQVKRGHRIYFRMQSGTDPLVSNGSFDRVVWTPTVRYQQFGSQQFEPDIFNRNIFDYSVKQDYLLSGPRELTIDTGIARFDLGGTLRKTPTMDTLWLVINQLKIQEKKYPGSNLPYQVFVKDAELFSKMLLPGDSLSVSVEKKNIGLSLTDSTNSYLEYAIISRSTVDLQHVQWLPQMQYNRRFVQQCLDAPTGNVGNCPGSKAYIDSLKKIFPIPRYVFADSLHIVGQRWQLADSTIYTVIPTVRFTDTLVFKDSEQSSADIGFSFRDSLGVKGYQQHKIAKGAREYRLPEMKLAIDSAQKMFGVFESVDTLLNSVASATMEIKRPDYKTYVYDSTRSVIVGETDTVEFTGTYRAYLQFAVAKNKKKGQFPVEVKNQLGQTLVSVPISYDSNRVQLPAEPVYFQATKGDVLFVNYLVRDTAVIARVTEARARINHSLAAFSYTKRKESKFGSMFRGWGQFLYNGMKGRAKAPIQEALLGFATGEVGDRRGEIESIAQRIATSGTNADVEMKGLDGYSPIIAPFTLMVPYADDSVRRWQGSDIAVYLDGGIVSSSRIGLKDVKLIDPFAQTVVVAKPAGNAATAAERERSRAYAIKKMTFSETRTVTAGPMKYAFTHSESVPATEIVADYLDINGDRFPDIVTKSQIQLTRPTGSLIPTPWGTRKTNRSKHSSNGITDASAFIHSSASSTLGGGQSPLTKQVTLMSSESNRAHFNAGLSVGIPTQGHIGEEQSLETWMDVNGDGLVDRVLEGGKVELNLGRRLNELAFTKPLNYKTGDISKSKNMSIPPGLSLGISLQSRSFVAGTGLMIANSAPAFTLLDFNGDGLVDRVEYDDNGTVRVEFNTGFNFMANKVPVIDISVPTSELNTDGIASLPVRFLPRIRGIKIGGIDVPNPINTWVDLDKRKANGSFSQSVSGAATFGFNIWIPFTPFIRFVFTPEASFQSTMGKMYRQFTDIDGDGYVDYLYSTHESNMQVRLSTVAKINKLSEVITPLGGRFEIDYKHSGATVSHPSGKWVIASVTVHDGDALDRDDPDARYDGRKEFDYESGQYDRYEREFTGFGKVVVMDKDFKDAVYRSTVLEYDTASYYVAGNLLKEYVAGAKGQKFNETTHDYYLYKLAPNGGNYNTRATAAGADTKAERYTGICFSAVKTNRKFNYEKNKTPIILNQTLYGYNSTGAVDNLKYREGKEVSDANFDYQTQIDLEVLDGAKNILDAPVRVKVFKDGTVFREQAASYNKEGKVARTTRKQSASFTEVSTFNYDDYGNVDTVVKASDITYAYAYDPTGTYVAEVTPTPGFSSRSWYDPRFGAIIRTLDKQHNFIRYQLDEFGRIDTIVGPKECNDENVGQCEYLYTIKIKYQIGKNPYAVVTHFDGPGRPGIQTISFANGFGQQIGVKKTAAVSNDQGKPNPARWVVEGRKLLDAMGRPTRLYYPALDDQKDGTKVFPIVNKEVRPTEKGYDEMDRPTYQQSPDSAMLYTMSYSTLNGLSVATTTAYNEAASGGNQVRALFTNGSGLRARETAVSSGDTLATQYRYDAFHQLKAVVDHRGLVTSYEYDLAGNKRFIIHPDGGKTEHIYDNAGRMVKKITANGRGAGDTIHYVYDTYNRLSRIQYSTDSSNNVRYYYGSATATKNSRDRIVFMEDASGAQSFTYGVLGEVTMTKRTIIVPFSKRQYTFTTLYEYDTWNRITSIQYPDGETVSYTYNEAGLLEKVTGRKRKGGKLQEPIPYVSDIQYDAFEKRIRITYRNGVTTQYGYDKKRRRLENLGVAGMTNDPTAKISLFSSYQSAYKYDNQSNVLFNDVTRSGYTMRHNYWYDDLNRLDSARGLLTRSGQSMEYRLGLDYDPLFSIERKDLELTAAQGANRLKIDHEDQMHYQPASHRLANLEERVTINDKDTSYNAEQYSHDANGNNVLRAMGTREQPHTAERKILWDEDNRIKAISMSGYVSNYVYDAGGERVIKMSIRGSGVEVNGKSAGRETITPVTFSLYANPYYSMRHGAGLYTKHIYIGSERIVSQLEGDSAFSRFDNQLHPVGQLAAEVVKGSTPKVDTIGYAVRLRQLNQRLQADMDSLKVPLGRIPWTAFDSLPVHVPSKMNHPFNSKFELGKQPSPTSPEVFNYYYHYNLTGSAAFITDDKKNAVQYVEYLPFGETFSEERTTYNSQYLFSGKEQDAESGLYYYGARYYDPHSYQWLGVDPMAEQMPGRSPFAFMRNNPLGMLDPDGRAEYANDFIGPLQQKDWHESARENNTQAWHAANAYNLQQDKGHKEYKNIGQRTDFYDWYQGASNAKGHQIRWPGAASKVAWSVDHMEEVPWLKEFADAGNEAIFNDVFGKLKEAYNSSPITGDAAEKWDVRQLTAEQELIQPLYEGLSKPLLFQIEGLAKGRQLLPYEIAVPLDLYMKYNGKYIPSFPLFGDILDVQQRVEYGIRAMGYPKR